LSFCVGVYPKCFTKVWQISDYRKVGSLDKEGFFVALSLISLAQQGKRLGLDAVREKGNYMFVESY
jgi:hypothetical protein